jgi:hypothetical protein
MPRGYPDFFGQQSFAYEGLFQQYTVTQNILPNTTATVCLVDYKGRVLCGLVRFRKLAEPLLDTIIVTIDNHVSEAFLISDFLTFGITQPNIFPIFLTHYSQIDGTFYYGFGVHPGITFGLSYKIEYTENDGLLIANWSRVYFARVV